MRVAIADSDVAAGRRLAGGIEQLLPTVDVLLYTDEAAALEGVEANGPDLVFVAPQVGELSGPEAAAKLRSALPRGSSLVGLVDTPDADWSVRYVEAGCTVVLSRPVDTLGLRTALRQHAGGIPGDT